MIEQPVDKFQHLAARITQHTARITQLENNHIRWVETTARELDEYAKRLATLERTVKTLIARKETDR